MTRNWKPVIESLLDALEEQRITLHGVLLDEEAKLFIVVQGDSPAERRSHAIELIDGVDSTILHLKWGYQSTTMLLVFDEAPEDLIADWSIPRSKTMELHLEAAAEAFSNLWEGKPCPQEEGPSPVTVRITEINRGYINFDNRKEAEEWIEEPSFDGVHWAILGSKFVIVDDDEDDSTDGSSWEDDSIQFPRLIAELEAQGLFSSEVVEFLAESMDLDSSHVYELVDRAQSRWDEIKSNTIAPAQAGE